MKEESKSKIKQEQKSREAFHKEFEEEVTTEHRRVIGEEPKKIKIEIERKEEPKKTESQVYKKPLLPRPSVIRSELKLVSRKLEPRVTPPLEIALTDKQRTLLYLLYNMFNGKNVKDVLAIVSGTLGIDIEDLLRELMTLENLNLIVVDNGIINFTYKGEIVVGTITIDNSIVNRVREAITRVPKTPFIHVSYVVGKLIDKENCLASMKTSRKELVVPTTPRVHVGNITLLKMDKSLSVYPKYKAVTITMPRIPHIVTPEINVKTVDKTMSITLTKKYKVTEKHVTKVAEKIKKVVESKGVRLPSSLLTMLFKPVKRYGVKGLLAVKPDRPVIIVAVKSPSDDYIATLLSILREIYRMKIGGLPVGRYTGTKVTRYIAEDELMRQGFIKVIDDSKADFLEFFRITKVEEFDKIDLNKLRDRLTELSVQGLSFLVFYVNRSKADSLLTYLALLRDKIAPAKVVVIPSRKLSTDQKREITRVAWGFVDPKEPLINDTLDQHFKRREEEFYDVLERIAKRKYAKIVRESHEDEAEEGLRGSESALHYQLKIFIVYYLMKKLKIPEEDIETEVELSVGSKKIIPDVYVKSRRLAIEIETFYGTGLTPWRKLERTIEKYLESNVAYEVWIVLPPLQTMLYLKDLISEIKELKEKGYSFIKLYTVDLSRGRLVPIEKIPRRLSKLFTKLASA